MSPIEGAWGPRRSYEDEPTTSGEEWRTPEPSPEPYSIRDPYWNEDDYYDLLMTDGGPCNVWLQIPRFRKMLKTVVWLAGTFEPGPPRWIKAPQPPPGYTVLMLIGHPEVPAIALLAPDEWLDSLKGVKLPALICRGHGVDFPEIPTTLQEWTGNEDSPNGPTVIFSDEWTGPGESWFHGMWRLMVKVGGDQKTYPAYLRGMYEDVLADAQPGSPEEPPTWEGWLRQLYGESESRGYAAGWDAFLREAGEGATHLRLEP